MALKGRRLNDIAMIWAKLGDGFADFQTVHIMKCSEWWHDCWAPLYKAPERLLSRDNIDSQVSVVMEK